MKFLTLLVSILILIAVLIPGSNIPDVSFVGVDKIVHICMFAAWAVAMRYDFPSVKPLLVFFMGILFSLVTEVVQIFAEGRTFDLYDMVSDGAGLLAGLMIARPVVKILDRLFKRKA